jgi:hypothetical protein
MRGVREENGYRFPRDIEVTTRGRWSWMPGENVIVTPDTTSWIHARLRCFGKTCDLRAVIWTIVDGLMLAVNRTDCAGRTVRIHD